MAVALIVISLVPLACTTHYVPPPECHGQDAYFEAPAWYDHWLHRQEGPQPTEAWAERLGEVFGWTAAERSEAQAEVLRRYDALERGCWERRE